MGLTRIIHVLEEPFHCSLWVTVPCGKQCLLATDGWEAHGLKLGHRFSIELGQCRGG